LPSHLGRRPAFEPGIAAYVLKGDVKDVQIAGGAAGTFDLGRVLSEGLNAGNAAAAACGFREGRGAKVPSVKPEPAYGIAPFWRLPPELSAPGKAFVDLQNDVTVADLELSDREGFGRAEHAKRYTTLGMATDQGKLANVNALGILSGLRGADLNRTGTTVFRPPYTGVALGALAGGASGASFQAKRLSAMHDWHDRHGAVFTQAGLWLRPYYFPRDGEDFAAAVRREVETVRSAAGIVDISTLGKFEVRGADAGAFLDRLYANTFSSLRTGRARYGLMLREDGIVFDDGTVSRLADDHFFVTVSTAHAAAVHEHMDHSQQVLWPELDVQFCDVCEQWAAMAVAGPESRNVLQAAVEGLDLGNTAFPPLSVAEATIGGVPVRVFRISFSGELAYEVFVASGYGEAGWEAILEAGRDFGISPYGTEAMTVMRTEKGHVAGPELDGRTTASDLGHARMMSAKKDYIGRRMTDRPGLQRPDRLQLVGLRALSDGAVPRMGAHLVTDPAARGASVSEGHVTTSVFSPTLGCGIGLGLLARGTERHGERLFAVFPLKDETVEVEVIDPVFVDAQGERARV
ncbi:MAG: glycine cleavage T C-terminal barrel domain-containing protein, partial [Methyloligellaceae bacterium]